MATAAATITRSEDDFIVVAWTLKTADRDGAVLGPQLGKFADRTVQVAGTWGGATFVLEGSNDGTNWVTLNDPTGTDISATVGSPLFQVLEAPLYVRPYLSVAGAAATLYVTLVARKPRSGQAVG
jgi:hypothetical protein